MCGRCPEESKVEKASMAKPRT
uniref:Uncharacterized protein n=1 Tax=Arundo donax TaxID=35708 RepID=A0A0A9H5H6_ARUDO